VASLIPSSDNSIVLSGYKEVVNLPPAQIFCAGTPKDKGSFFEDIWLSSDKKGNGKEWIPTNP
jgi:hypothetical protein